MQPKRIDLKHGGHIDIYKKRKYTNILFDLIQGNYNLTPQAIKKVEELFTSYILQTAQTKPKYPYRKAYMTVGSPTSGSVFKLPSEYVDVVITELQKILENEENLVRIPGAIDEP